jgi:translocator protein
MQARTKQRAYLRMALITIPAIVLAGWLSGWISGSGYGNPWFDTLVKPAIMPPGWVFGVVWTIIYVLMAEALAMILVEPPSGFRRAALILFFVQLALNLAWSPIFFAAHDIDLAALWILAMLALAGATAGQFWFFRRLAALLMVPYLAWLCFASVLVEAIDRLNPGASQPLFG